MSSKAIFSTKSKSFYYLESNLFQKKEFFLQNFEEEKRKFVFENLKQVSSKKKLIYQKILLTIFFVWKI